MDSKIIFDSRKFPSVAKRNKLSFSVLFVLACIWDIVALSLYIIFLEKTVLLVLLGSGVLLSVVLGFYLPIVKSIQDEIILSELGLYFKNEFFPWSNIDIKQHFGSILEFRISSHPTITRLALVIPFSWTEFRENFTMLKSKIVAAKNGQNNPKNSQNSIKE